MISDGDACPSVGKKAAPMVEDTEDRYHEDAGAAVLKQFFPKVVTDCCQHHVAAKRYLCATDPEYFQKLSTASIHSLNLQGGPMSEAELRLVLFGLLMSRLCKEKFL